MRVCIRLRVSCSLILDTNILLPTETKFGKFSSPCTVNKYISLCFVKHLLNPATFQSRVMDCKDKYTYTSIHLYTVNNRSHSVPLFTAAPITVVSSHTKPAFVETFSEEKRTVKILMTAPILTSIFS